MIFGLTWDSTLPAIISGLFMGGTVTGIAALWVNRKQRGAETAKTLQEGEKTGIEADLVATQIKQAEVDIAKTVTETSAQLIEEVREQAVASRESSDLQIVILRKQNEELLAQNEELFRSVAELKEQTEKIPRLEADITALIEGVKLLNAQLLENNITPNFVPPEKFMSGGSDDYQGS